MYTLAYSDEIDSTAEYTNVATFLRKSKVALLKPPKQSAASAAFEYSPDLVEDEISESTESETHPTALVFWARLVLILERFTVLRTNTLFAYLVGHQNILPYLLQAADELDKRFGDSELQLALVDDPEAYSSQELFIYVRITLSVEEALVKLDAFDVEWFLEADERANHGFNVNLRFA